MMRSRPGNTERHGRIAPPPTHDGDALRAAVAVLLSIAVAGCGVLGGLRDRPDGPSLGAVIEALPAAAATDRAQPAPDRPAPDRNAVLQAYAAIEGQLADPALNHAVGRRLADLSMEVAEDRAADGESEPYATAIERYTALLGAASGADRAEVLYQLARASDMAGAPDAARTWLDRLVDEHPDHPLVVEARFRRAEMAFSAERWMDAERDYAAVVDAGPASPWWLNAVYLSGWARFRAGEHAAALARFYDVLQRLEETGGTTHETHEELRNDTLRVATLALDYLDGAQTLADSMRELDQPVWQYDVYRALAEAHLAQERYLDSVAAWETFVDEQPLDQRAPTAQRHAIEILRDADFPTEARERQARFVAAYGIDSAFWAAHDASVRATYLPALESYLEDLARSSHATAQRTRDPEAFATAARWYQDLVRTFPDDPDAAGYLFMLGESLTEAGNTAAAVAAFQRVIREHPNHAQAAEAGYAAILGLDALAGAADPVERESRLRGRIEGQLEFATLFPGDPRTPAVRAAAADGLFALDDHPAAVAQAESLLADSPSLPAELRATALTVAGHGRFALADYAGAEAAYRELLASGPEPTLREVATERLQAAIYRQAEASERDGAHAAAVAHYRRVGDVAPDSELAIQASFDAVAVLESGGQVAAAAQALDAFRTRHGNHPLAAGAPRRLATLWEQSGDGPLAASAWLEVAQADEDPEIRRQALYRAAELSLQSGDSVAAAAHFGSYASTYPHPADLRMEALDHLDRIALETGDTAQRRVWLAAKVEQERTMRASGATQPALERARQLAAAAQYEIAREARAGFDAIRLIHPLAENLTRKQQALLEALAAFEAAAAYEVADYVTASTWQIGDLYGALARALLESARPEGLSADALAEYELLLEEQAFPFEEQAIAVHEINAKRSWQGRWDEWVERSFADLGRLVPARFDRPEEALAVAPGDSTDGCPADTAAALELRRRGDFAGAEQRYLACIAAQPDYRPAHLNLGILYELYLGRPGEALDAYQRYQALAPEPDPRVAGWMQLIERSSGA